MQKIVWVTARFFLTTALGIYLLVVTAAALAGWGLFLDKVSSSPDDAILFASEIKDAFNGKKERVAVRDIFPGEWNYVCIHEESYGYADKTIRQYLKLPSSGDDLKVWPENFSLDGSEGVLSFVTRQSQNNIFSYVAEMHRYPDYFPIENQSGQPCMEKDSAYLQIIFYQGNFLKSRLILTNGEKDD